MLRNVFSWLVFTNRQWDKVIYPEAFSVKLSPLTDAKRLQPVTNSLCHVSAKAEPDVYLFFCLEMADKTPEMPVKTVEII